MTASDNTKNEQKQELYTFLFLTIFLAPIIAVAVVGSYGFAIWMSQLIMGPPTL